LWPRPVEDNNKNISAITYNHLNLPAIIGISGEGIINYVYDALGNKLRKQVVDSTVTPIKITNVDYLGIFIYQNDTLQLITQEEGRVRVAKTLNATYTMYYDYFVKDHLGNVRMLLTDQWPASIDFVRRIKN